MIYRVFAVKDNVAGAFHGPFISQNEGTACRVVGAFVGQSGHPYSDNVADYALYEVGAFDDATGNVAGHDPRHVCSLVDLRRSADS